MAKGDERTDDGAAKNFIRKWRNERGRTIDDLAIAAGIDKGNLSKIERGMMRFNSDQLARLAIALNVPRGHLLDVDPKMSNAASLPDPTSGISPEAHDALRDILSRDGMEAQVVDLLFEVLPAIVEVRRSAAAADRDPRTAALAAIQVLWPPKAVSKRH